MAYVRTKKTRGREYYQLVEGRRENGKVRQKVLVHLGDCPSVSVALRRWPARIVKLRLLAHEAREHVKFAKDRAWGGRRTASPHTYSEWPKVFDRYAGETSGPGWEIYDIYRAWNLHKYYWDHMEYAERLEREADSLEERYLHLCEVQGVGTDEARRLLADRLRRIIDAKRRRKERREAQLLRGFGILPLSPGPKP
jgi:hypothetical protein